MKMPELYNELKQCVKLKVCNAKRKPYLLCFTMQFYAFDKKLLDAFPEVTDYKSFDVESFTSNL